MKRPISKISPSALPEQPQTPTGANIFSGAASPPSHSVLTLDKIMDRPPQAPKKNYLRRTLSRSFFHDNHGTEGANFHISYEKEQRQPSPDVFRQRGTSNIEEEDDPLLLPDANQRASIPYFRGDSDEDEYYGDVESSLHLGPRKRLYLHDIIFYDEHFEDRDESYATEELFLPSLDDNDDGGSPRPVRLFQYPITCTADFASTISVGDSDSEPDNEA